jgi:nucleoid DNA-binding protein
VKLSLLIKEVAENLQLPYKDVRDIVKFAFLTTGKEMKDSTPKITVRYLGTFTKKLSKRETYKNYLRIKNENNRDK